MRIKDPQESKNVVEVRVLVAQSFLLWILLGTLQAAHCLSLPASRWPWLYPAHSSGLALLGPCLSLIHVSHAWGLGKPEVHTTESNFLPSPVFVLGFFFLGWLRGTSSVTQTKKEERLPKILCRGQCLQKGTFNREDLSLSSSLHLHRKGKKVRHWQSQREPTAQH